MKRELLNIEGGKIKKGNNVIFDDLSLELFQGEITGIVFDDILEQKLFIDMLLGDVLLYSGKIFVNEERKAYEEAARLLKQQVAVIGSKSKLLSSITIEDNIFLFSDRKLFLDQKEYKERFQKLRTELNISDDMPHKVRNLSAKEKVIIELLKAYEERKKIVILDEITSLLSEKDLGEVFSLIDKMKSQMSFLVTVGFEDFIMEWMESIAVVQNGRTTFVSGISQLNCKLSKVLKALIYENKAETFGAYGQKVINGQNNVLEVRDVSTCYLKNLNFTLCSGELLKIYYSDEKSKSSFWEMFSGEESIEEGQIYISEKLYKVSNMSQAVREGVGFITEAPYRSMILDNMSATENVSVPLHEKVRGFWFAKKYTRSVSDFLQNDELNKKKLKNIGNAELQKLAYEKWLVYQPKIVIIENPFTDMDINMREITRKMIGALQKRGIGVILLTANFAIMNKIKGESMFLKHGVLTREEEW